MPSFGSGRSAATTQDYNHTSTATTQDKFNDDNLDHDDDNSNDSDDYNANKNDPINSLQHQQRSSDGRSLT